MPRNYYYYSIVSRKNKYIWRAQRASQGKKLKVPGGQSAARSPRHQPAAAKPRPQRRAKDASNQRGPTHRNCQVTATFARSGRSGGWGGGVGWGASEKVRGHLHRQAFGKKDIPPARETRNFPLFCYRNLVLLPVFSISPWPSFPDRLFPQAFDRFWPILPALA